MRRGLVGGLTVVALLLVAPLARAVTPVPCINLQAAMNSAAAGQVLALKAGTCQANLTVTNTKPFTLEGVSSGGHTVLEPGTGLAMVPIIQSSANAHFTLSHLTLTGAQGGALSLHGIDQAVTVTHDRFTNDVGNHAISIVESGAANHPTTIEDSTFSGDSGAIGGAILWESDQPLVVTGNSFTHDSSTDPTDGGGGLSVLSPQAAAATTSVSVTNNVFGGPSASEGDTAQSTGGGAFFSLDGGQSLTLTGNRFEHDAISGADTSPASRVGGGVFIGRSKQSPRFTVNQAHNLFQGNVIREAAASGSPNILTGGAGEWISGLTVISTADSFLGNRVGVNDAGPPEGGGLGAIATATSGSIPAESARFVGRDDLFSGNSTASGGWGGAIYVGGPQPPCTTSPCQPSSVTLADSTVVNNWVDAARASQGGAIWGSPNDLLKMNNSIVYGNTPHPEIRGLLLHPSGVQSLRRMPGARRCGRLRRPADVRRPPAERQRHRNHDESHGGCRRKWAGAGWPHHGPGQPQADPVQPDHLLGHGSCAGRGYGRIRGDVQAAAPV